MREAIGTVLAPCERPGHERAVAAARAVLGEAAFEAARTLGLQVTDPGLALDDPPPGDPDHAATATATAAGPVPVPAPAPLVPAQAPAPAAPNPAAAPASAGSHPGATPPAAARSASRARCLRYGRSARPRWRSAMSW